MTCVFPSERRAVTSSEASAPLPSVGFSVACSGGKLTAQAPLHVLVVLVSFLNMKRVRPRELTRILPSPTFATPTVAGAPLAVVGDVGWPLALLLPPHPASEIAVRGSAARVARTAIGRLRVMLAPFVMGRRGVPPVCPKVRTNGRGKAVCCLHRQRPSSV